MNDGTLIAPTVVAEECTACSWTFEDGDNVNPSAGIVRGNQYLCDPCYQMHNLDSTETMNLAVCTNLILREIRRAK